MQGLDQKPILIQRCETFSAKHGQLSCKLQSHRSVVFIDGRRNDAFIDVENGVRQKSALALVTGVVVAFDFVAVALGRFGVGIKQKVELVDHLLLLVALDLDAVEASGQLASLFDRPNSFPTLKSKRLFAFFKLVFHFLQLFLKRY